LGDLSPHFSTDEFRCHDDKGNPCHYCNGSVKVDARLIDKLEAIREFADLPIQITSGYRCPTRNAEVGGEANSAHLTGEAADFFVAGNRDRFKFIEALVWCEVRRYGIGSSFLHVDVSLKNPDEVTWGYWK
jgi:uncharacterized protein YcbK (DUF882 family)